jgi:hypothetical protein
MFQVKSAGNNVWEHKPPGGRNQNNAFWKWWLLCRLAPNKRCDLSYSCSMHKVLHWWKSIRKCWPNMARHVSVKRKSTSGYRNIRMRYKWWKILHAQQLWQIHTYMTILAKSFAFNICLPSYVFAEILPDDNRNCWNSSNVMCKLDVFQ